MWDAELKEILVECRISWIFYQQSRLFGEHEKKYSLRVGTIMNLFSCRHFLRIEYTYSYSYSSLKHNIVSNLDNLTGRKSIVNVYTFLSLPFMIMMPVINWCQLASCIVTKVHWLLHLDNIIISLIAWIHKQLQLLQNNKSFNFYWK